MTKKISDIWERVLASDPSAWEDLVVRYASLVFSVARHVGLSSSDAEDCAQQTWMALYRGRASVRDPSRLPAWLVSTTRRKAQKITQKRLRVEKAYQQADVRRDVAHPDEEIIRLQRQAQLEYALEQLDERCARLLRAIFMSPEELTYRDIARRLGIPANSLGPTRSRCLNKLRKILAGFDDWQVLNED